MCGIGGYYCWGDARPSQDAIKALLMANQARGRSAAGVAYIDSKKQIVYRKQKGPAENLISSLKSETWAEIAASPRALIHARATTKGTEDVNVNNHPVVGLGWVVVHNGLIMNDDELFDYYKIKRFAEVDTAAISLVLSLGKDYLGSLQHLSLLSGSATTAVWSVHEPERIAIVKLGGNDVWLFLDESKNILYWSSAVEAIRDLPGPQLGPLRLRTIRSLPEDKVLVLSPGGRDATRLFAVTRSPFVQRWTAQRGTRHISMADTGSKKKGEVGFSYIPSTVKEKPAPCWDDVVHKWMILGLETNMFRSQLNLVSKTLHTPYGRWVFSRGKGVEIEREFFGLKRMKRYWAKTRGHIPRFPAIFIERDHTEYDNLCALEHYTLKEKERAGAEIQTPGLVCPWCGAVARRVGWDTRQGRCDFCNIQSKPPED